MGLLHWLDYWWWRHGSALLLWRLLMHLGCPRYPLLDLGLLVVTWQPRGLLSHNRRLQMLITCPVGLMCWSSPYCLCRCSSFQTHSGGDKSQCFEVSGLKRHSEERTEE